MAVVDALSRCRAWATAHLDAFAPDEASASTMAGFEPLSGLVLALVIARRHALEVEAELDWAWQQVEHGESLLRVFVAHPDRIRLAGLVGSFMKPPMPGSPFAAAIRRLPGAARCHSIRGPTSGGNRSAC